jgi:membrane associated rhomboid family serine protease
MLKFLKTQSFLNKNNLKYTKKITEQNLHKMPKRHQSNMNDFFSNIPPITKFIMYANGFIYGIGFFMSYGDYIKQFFYHNMALKHGKFHVLLTTHFAKGNFFDFVIDTLFTVMIGRQLEFMLGYQNYLKLILTSVGLGSFILLTMHNENYFIKSDAIFRAMIMYIVLLQPQAKFMLFPFPIGVPGYVLAGIVLLLDLLTKKWVNFGGAGAALLMSRGLI